MRRRMLVIALPLLTMLLLALMVPLLFAYAADRTQDQFVGRLGDVARFAVLAEDAIELDETTPWQESWTGTHRSTAEGSSSSTPTARSSRARARSPREHGRRRR